MAAEATRSSGEESGGGNVRRKEFVKDILLRIMIGGVAVSGFAMLGELPKAQKLCRTFWGGPFGFPGHPAAHGYERRGSRTRALKPGLWSWALWHLLSMPPS